MQTRVGLLLLTGWLAIVGTLSAWAQGPVRVSGRVTTADGQALPGASVLLRQQTADSTIIEFALSNADGSYELTADTDTGKYLLSAQLLGFAPRYVSMQRLAGQSAYTQLFRLEPQATALNEVVVRAKTLPMRAKGDTTVYNAGSFTDGSERSVEDLLKKLPGIKVSDDGTITANGKRIDKVLIEGEDLFSRNYKLISRSMAASLVDKVEAIANFSDNPLLHDVEKSGETVLNLTIKTDRAGTVFGSLSAEVGTGGRYEGKGSLFSLLKQLKAAAIGQINTLGNDPIPDTEYYLTADDQKRTNPTLPLFNPLIPPQLSQMPPLLPERFTFNNARLGAGSLAYRPNERFRIRLYGYRSTDTRRFMDVTDNTFLFDSLRFNVRDSTRLTYSPATSVGHLQLDYNQPNRFTLRFTSSYKQAHAQSDLFINSKNVFLPEIVRSVYSTDSRTGQYHLNSVWSLFPKNVLVFDASYSRTRLPQTAQINSRRYAPYFGADSSANQLKQQAGLQFAGYQGSVYWKGSYHTMQYGLGLGASMQQQTLTTRATLIATTTTEPITDPITENNAFYSHNQYYLNASYSIRFGTIIVSASNMLQSAWLRFDDYQRKNRLSNSALLWNPSLGVGVGLGGQRRLLVAVAHTQTPPSPQQLMVGYVVSDYRSLNRAQPQFNIVTGNALLLNFSDLNTSGLYSLLANLSLTQERNPYIYHLAISNSLSLLTLIPYNSSLSRYGLQTDFTHFVKGFNISIRADGNLSRAGIATSQGATVQQSLLVNAEAGLAAGTAFSGIINGEAGSRFSMTRLTDTNTPDDMGKGIQQAIFIRPRVVLKINPAKTLRLRFVNEWVLWQNGLRSNTLFLSDGTVQWTPKRKPFSLELIGRNLFNARHYSFTQFSGNYLIAQTQFLLQPRYVSVRFDWQF